MERIVNLTPHPLVITEGPLAGAYPPSGKCARIAHLPDGEVIDLPPPGDATAYVVSVLVAEAVLVAGLPRDDIFVPGEQVRDEAGRIVGCRRLDRVEQASPAALCLAHRRRDNRVEALVRELVMQGRGREAAERLDRIAVYQGAHVACYLAARAEAYEWAALSLEATLARWPAIEAAREAEIPDQGAATWDARQAVQLVADAFRAAIKDCLAGRPGVGL